MTVYILEGSAGSYEDYSRFIIGIYSTLALAENAKQLHLEKIQEYNSRYTPEESAKLENAYIHTIPTSPECNDFLDWKYGQYSGINDWTNITEIVVDKTVFNWEPQTKNQK